MWEVTFFYSKPLNELVLIKKFKKYCLNETYLTGFSSTVSYKSFWFFLIGNSMSFSLFLDVLLCVNTILSFNDAFSTISKSSSLSFDSLWCNFFFAVMWRKFSEWGWREKGSEMEMVPFISVDIHFSILAILKCITVHNQMPLHQRNNLSCPWIKYAVYIPAVNKLLCQVFLFRIGWFGHHTVQHSCAVTKPGQLSRCCQMR